MFLEIIVIVKIERLCYDASCCYKLLSEVDIHSRRVVRRRK